MPEDFPYYRIMHVALDRGSNRAILPSGLAVPLRPFFGQLAVAPPKAFGRQNSKEPREFGGNIDCKELIAGSTIYLPVWNEGALFSTGDGHAAQGDGEVNGTAIETALEGTFEFHVRKDLGWRLPRAETATHLIAFGLDADLDDAARAALREMIDWIVDAHRHFQGRSLYVVQLRRRPARHADRQQRQGRARDDRPQHPAAGMNFVDLEQVSLRYGEDADGTLALHRTSSRSAAASSWRWSGLPAAASPP